MAFDINQFLQMLGQAPQMGQGGGQASQIPGALPSGPSLQFPGPSPGGMTNSPAPGQGPGLSPVTGQNPNGDLLVHREDHPLTQSGQYSHPSFIHQLLQGLMGAGLQGGGQGQGSMSNGASPSSGAGQGGILSQILQGALGGVHQSMQPGGQNGQNQTGSASTSQFPWWLFLNRPQ